MSLTAKGKKKPAEAKEMPKGKEMPPGMRKAMEEAMDGKGHKPEMKKSQKKA